MAAVSTKRSGCAERDMIRSFPRGIPASGTCGWKTNPACAFPPKMIPSERYGRAGGSNTFGTGPCSRPTARRTPGSREPSRRPSNGSSGAAPKSEPFLLWLDVFSPHGPWDPPQPYRDQYMTVEPDEFEAGEEGDLVDEASEEDAEEIDIEEVPVLIDVPAGAVGDVLSEAELFRLRRTYAGTVTLVDRWLGELFDAMRRLGRWRILCWSSPATRVSRWASTAMSAGSDPGCTKS